MHHNQSQNDGTNNMQFVIGYSKFGVSLKSLSTELVSYKNSKKIVSCNISNMF